MRADASLLITNRATYYGGDVGIEAQHIEAVFVDQGIHLDPRDQGAQDAEYRRGQQHVTVMAELYDEDAAYDGGINGIGEHRATITKPRRLVHEQRQDLGHRGNPRARAIRGVRAREAR
jgi:hypothetical protein